VENVEAGRRFYVKISDADLPVLHRLGQTVAVEVTSTSGDAERVECTPLSGTDEFFVGSVPTVLGKASERTHGDGKLQVIGGDKIKTVYVDANTFDGKQEVNRDKTVRVVSTGAVTFTLGDYDSPAPGAFLGQPVFVLLQDADLDTSDQVDAVEVRMVSRYARPEPEEQAAGADGQVDLDALFSDDDQDEYVVRDEVTLTLEELPDPEASAGAPVRTGRFVGRLTLQQGREAQDANRTDSLMECILGDELMVSYTDTLHINGEAPRTINATIRVVDEISANPQVQQQVIEDPIVGFEKNLVEAEAFLELSRIFNSMGLKEGATEKADNGLQRVDQIIQADFPVPRPMVEQAFKLKWELQQSKGNLSGALMTCKLFSEMFPDSAFVDQALLGIADVRREAGSFAEAIRIYDQILGLPNSLAKAEAQFRIAQTYQAEADQDPDNEGTASQAVRAYEAVAQQYPDSEFAGEALAHLVDYYIENSDYVQADDLLRQVFLDHPDADFLDQMLLKWALVAARMGDFQKAYDKCSQLVFEYPTSRFAGKAKQILQTLEKRLNR
jgi:outer membrane protein assembly factor BamD